MPDWLVIADDLTGACDSGAAFAARGWTVQVAFSRPSSVSDAQVWVLTSESRALSAPEAARAVAAGLGVLPIPAGCRIYKKIDSTLRGNPAEELGAVMRALGLERALVTPAFPAQGRVVRDGRVWVNQVALEDTAMGRETRPANLAALFAGVAPVCEIPLDLSRQGMDPLAQIFARTGPVLFIADAEVDADLQRLAQAGLRAGLSLFCGSAGLAHALVAGSPARAPAFDRRSGPGLVVAGSRNPATQRQVAFARQSGLAVIAPSMEELLTGAGQTQALQRLYDRMAQGKWAVLSAERIPFAPGQEALVAAALANLAAGVCEEHRLGALVLTGGETAMAVCRALGCGWIDLEGEIQPGVVLGRLRAGRQPGMPVVTKAGGFGDPETLVTVIRFLAGEQG